MSCDFAETVRSDMSGLRTVRYAGRELGNVRTYERGDWKNPEREPGEMDFRMIRAAAVADFLHEVLDREPKRNDEAEPHVPWPLVVIREGCRSEDGSTNPQAEEDALTMYVNRHGMNQILSVWGADVPDLLRQMEALGVTSP